MLFRNSFAAVNGKILITEQNSLYVANSDGSGRVKIADGFADGVWSPDGSKIVAAGPGADGWPRLFTMNPDGSNKRQITNAGWGYNDREPSWSPDGTKIVFHRAIAHSYGTTFAVHVVNADGTNEKLLAHNTAFPDWSPDGRTIAYTSYPDEQALYIMNADGSNKRYIYRQGWGAEWSPDGSKIAITYHDIYTSSERIGAVMVSDGTMTPITTPANPGDHARNPGWSPDGSKIVFLRRNRGAAWAVYTINTDGSGIQEVSTGMAASWQPLPDPPAPSSSSGLGGSSSAATSAAPVRAHTATGSLPAAGIQNLEDTEAPTTPGHLTATSPAGRPVVVLTWPSSTDNSDNVAYRLERSQDREDWMTVGEDISDTAYTDSDVRFNETYQYRLQAYDAAGNTSGYAKASVSTGTFEPNTMTDSDTVIRSADGWVVITIPAGALTEDAMCSVELDFATLGPVIDDYELAAGPYEVVCKNRDGIKLTTFLKPLTVTVTLPHETRSRYREIVYYGQVSADEWVKVPPVSRDKSTGSDTMTLDGMRVIAAMGQQKTRPLWLTILIVMLISGGLTFGVLYVLKLLYGKRLQSVYDDYFRKAHGL